MHVHSVREAGAEVAGRQDWHFPLFLAHGVTGVRNMGGEPDNVILDHTRFSTTPEQGGIARPRRRELETGRETNHGWHPRGYELHFCGFALVVLWRVRADSFYGLR